MLVLGAVHGLQIRPILLQRSDLDETHTFAGNAHHFANGLEGVPLRSLGCHERAVHVATLPDGKLAPLVRAWPGREHRAEIGTLVRKLKARETLDPLDLFGVQLPLDSHELFLGLARVSFLNRQKTFRP